MRKIKKIVSHMHDELHDAEHYMIDALAIKDEDKSLADVYKRLAEQELRHCEMEHNEVVRIIRERRDAGQQPRQTMMAIWEWQHEQMIEHEAQIREMIRMFQ